MELRFNDPDEFVAELRQAPPDAEPVLRVTVRRRLDPLTGTFAHVSVVAGYLRLLATGPEPRVLAVILDAYQGQDWGAGFEQTRETLQRAQDLIVRLQSQPATWDWNAAPGPTSAGLESFAGPEAAPRELRGPFRPAATAAGPFFASRTGRR